MIKHKCVCVCVWGVSESGKRKKVCVQWFVRVSEVPLNKLKQLGREPHPQEIFFYQGRSCDDEVNAESILRPVQVLTTRVCVCSLFRHLVCATNV